MPDFKVKGFKLLISLPDKFPVKSTESFPKFKNSLLVLEIKNWTGILSFLSKSLK